MRSCLRRCGVPLGLSIDWSQTYHTIGEHPQRVAQKAFLRNLARGEAYQQDAPGLWDVTFQTAVAQAELECREYPGFYHKVAFRFRGRHADLHRDHPSRTARGLHLADREPERRALQAVFRPVRLLPAVQGQGADSGAPGRRNGQGRRYRDVLYVR